MSCGVGCRLGSDPKLLWLWLWRRLVATAPIGPLAWEPPYATGVAQEMAKRQKKKTNKKTKPFSDGQKRHHLCPLRACSLVTETNVIYIYIYL